MSLFDPASTDRRGERPRGVARVIRRGFGAADAVMAVTAVIAVAINIADRIAQNTWDPTHFFQYFTIQTTLLNTVVFALGAFFSLARVVDPRWYVAVRACIVSYGVVVGVVYNLLLAGIPASDGYINSFPWTNDFEHGFAPIYLFVEWILVPGRTRLAWKVVGICAAYPIAWAAASMVRGLAGDGWFPYFFLNPGEAGWNGVALYIVAIAAFMMGLCSFAVGVQRAHARFFVDTGLDRNRL